MFTSTGTVEYRADYSMALRVDPEISRYYRQFIPKWIPHNVPRYPPHITIVRSKYEKPKNLDAWKKYPRRKIVFEYESFVHIGKQYIWLSAHCKALEELRLELGLDRCFDKFKWFHITIANRKGLT